MKKIRTKLWIGMMFLVLIVLILLWLFQIVFFDRFYMDFKKSQIENAANTVIQSLDQQNVSDGTLQVDSIQDQLESLVVQQQLSVEIANSNRWLVYKANHSNALSQPNAIKEATINAHEGANRGLKTSSIVEHPKLGYEFLIMGMPIEIEKSVIGSMVLIVPLAPIDETVDLIKLQLWVITIILLISSMTISYFLSRHFAKPISELNQQAVFYSEGLFDVKNHVSGKDEIANLAKQMNHMGDHLSQNERLQKEIIANVSHELRTPLTLIRGFAETIKDVTGNQPEKRDRQLGVIINETIRLNQLIDEILDLSQLQSGTFDLKREDFSVVDLLKELKEKFESSTINRQFVIEDLSANPVMHADRKKMEQVFYNLISNAFYYSAADTKVTVRLRALESRLRIEIIDEGIGIDAEELKHVFDRYYRGKQALDSHSGNGLGLAIVHSVLEVHQFPHGVESKVGKGTLFWFETI